MATANVVRRAFYNAGYKEHQIGDEEIGFAIIEQAGGKWLVIQAMAGRDTTPEDNEILVRQLQGVMRAHRWEVTYCPAPDRPHTTPCLTHKVRAKNR